MTPKDEREPEPAREAEVLLALTAVDGSVTSVGPLSRARAEALVEVYGRAYPGGTFWVEPLRREVEDLHVGRVRRHRRTSSTKASPPDH